MKKALYIPIPQILSNTLDPANPFWVAFIAGVPNEEYQIDSLCIHVSGAPVSIPEPSTMILLETSLIGFVGYEYRRKKQMEETYCK